MVMDITLKRRIRRIVWRFNTRCENQPEKEDKFVELMIEELFNELKALGTKEETLEEHDKHCGCGDYIKKMTTSQKGE